MSHALPSSVDVVVIGAGNAAFCAVLAAAVHGVSVLILERSRRAKPVTTAALPPGRSAASMTMSKTCARCR